jgi:hypothetical protein
MIWEPKWPFKSREHALAHEHEYLVGSHTISGSRQIPLVDECDLEIERWLESGGAARLRKNPSDTEVIRNIYLWKMRSTNRCADAPNSILSEKFAALLGAVLDAHNDSEMANPIDALTKFGGVKIRAVSAFIYWLRPDEYQVIDRRVTAALNLLFTNTDYTRENYLQYCVLSRDLGAKHDLSLRQIDRALFTFQKLSTKKIRLH